MADCLEPELRSEQLVMTINVVADMLSQRIILTRTSYMLVLRFSGGRGAYMSVLRYFGRRGRAYLSVLLQVVTDGTNMDGSCV